MEIEYASTPYCTPDDVARFFDKVDGFDASTTPTESEVEELILEQSTWIDRQTEHAWRANTVNEAYRDLTGPYIWDTGVEISLAKRQVREFDSAKGDKLEVWEGDEWNDWLTDPSYEAGRENDYWIDSGTGMLYILDRFFVRRSPRLRLTYRYGADTIPKDIQRACAKQVAVELLEGEQFTMNVSGSGEAPVDAQRATERWREDVQRVVDERTEAAFLDTY